MEIRKQRYIQTRSPRLLRVVVFYFSKFILFPINLSPRFPEEALQLTSHRFTWPQTTFFFPPFLSLSWRNAGCYSPEFIDPESLRPCYERQRRVKTIKTDRPGRVNLHFSRHLLCKTSHLHSTTLFQCRNLFFNTCRRISYTICYHKIRASYLTRGTYQTTTLSQASTNNKMLRVTRLQPRRYPVSSAFSYFPNLNPQLRDTQCARFVTISQESGE